MAWSTVLSMTGWYLLPDLITRKLISFGLYNRFISKIWNPRDHYRYTFALVVLSYLIYTLVDSARSIQPNFYQLLQVSPDVDDAGLKAAFHRMSRLYHPDRMRNSQGHEGELFMHMRSMYEALRDPVKRFAYDRFGSDVLNCTNCPTSRDYLNHGLLQSIAFHVISLASLVFFSAVGAPSPASFWRYVIFVALLLLELSVILSPFPISLPRISLPTLPGTPPAFDRDAVANIGTLFVIPITRPPFTSLPLRLLGLIFPSRVPFQHVKLLHQLFIFLSMALTRVAPALFPPQLTEEMLALERSKAIMSMTQAIENETRSAVQNTLRMVAPPNSAPGTLDANTVSLLGSSMENVLMEDALARDVPQLWNERKMYAENVYEQRLTRHAMRQQNQSLLSTRRKSPSSRTPATLGLFGAPQISSTQSTAEPDRATGLEGYWRGRSVSC